MNQDDDNFELPADTGENQEDESPMAEDDDGSGIANCYHRALQSIDFPAELGGREVWSFNIIRSQVLPE